MNSPLEKGEFPLNSSWFNEPQGQELEALIQLFKALGNTSRIKILLQISCSEACVNEVAGKLNMSASAVSHHIHILRTNGLVRWHRKGKTILYAMKDDHVGTMITQAYKHIEKTFKTRSVIHK